MMDSSCQENYNPSNRYRLTTIHLFSFIPSLNDRRDNDHWSPYCGCFFLLLDFDNNQKNPSLVVPGPSRSSVVVIVDRRRGFSGGWMNGVEEVERNCIHLRDDDDDWMNVIWSPHTIHPYTIFLVISIIIIIKFIHPEKVSLGLLLGAADCVVCGTGKEIR